MSARSTGLLPVNGQGRAMRLQRHHRDAQRKPTAARSVAVEYMYMANEDDAAEMVASRTALSQLRLKPRL